MTSFIPNHQNPFLKDYSQTTLLKKNYQVLKVSNLLTKQYQNNKETQILHLKSNYSIPTASTQNPFHKKTFDPLNLINERRNLNSFKMSQSRSLSQSRNLLSIEKSSFCRALQDIGTKELWKNQLQKQVRYQLKQYGPQTLRYQYHPLQKYTSEISNNNQKPINTNYKQIEKSSRISNQSKNSKFLQNSLEEQKKTPKFNRNIVTSQYYGYDQGTNRSDYYFYNQKSTKIQQPKRQSTFLNDKNTRSKHIQRHSCYEEIIPEDKNQDLQTIQNLNKLHIPQEPDVRRSKISSIYDPKQTSIENIYTNNLHDSSVFSNFGASSEMYESGANFRVRFGHPKQGPLNIKAFDDNKSQQWQNDQTISRQNIGQYPDQLQYNNKIYWMISM